MLGLEDFVLLLERFEAKFRVLILLLVNLAEIAQLLIELLLRVLVEIVFGC